MEGRCEAGAMAVLMRQDWRSSSSRAELRTRPVILPPTRYVSLLVLIGQLAMSRPPDSLTQ